MIELPELDAMVADTELKVVQTPIYPLNAPGLPLPGDMFIKLAQAQGDETEVAEVKLEQDGKSRKQRVLQRCGPLLEKLVARALYDSTLTLPLILKTNASVDVPFQPGHLWGENMDRYGSGQYSCVSGPQPADVMVISKMPTFSDIQAGRYMTGDAARILLSIIHEQHIPASDKWYVTSVLKFLPPDGSSIKQEWINACAHLLQQELRLVRPKFILCLGADAVKGLLGKKINVSQMDGRFVEYSFPLHQSENDEPVLHTAKLMATVHPSAISRAPDQRRVLERGMARFSRLLQGQEFGQQETDIDHREIRSMAALEEAIAAAEAYYRTVPRWRHWLGVDAEWHGEHPINAGAFIRTIQFAWQPKHAASIVVNDTTGNWCFEGTQAQLVERLNRFFKGKRLVGHFLVADLEWLTHFGLHQALKSFRVPLLDQDFKDFAPDHQRELARLGFGPGSIVPAWARTYIEGGWDTGLAGHAVEETAQLGLEVLSSRFTNVPRYDLPLEKWKEGYCREHKLKKSHLEGYGPCPDEVLVPYGAYDADVEIRLQLAQERLINCDYNGNCCREPFWESMLTVPVILEMHQTGVPLDKKRVDYFTNNFMAARAAQEQKIQTWAQWPDFNIRSVFEVREFLFGEFLTGRTDKDGQPVRKRPAEALCLGLQPLVDTSKPPKLWTELVEKGLDKERTPGTGKMILAILAQDNKGAAEQINWIRDYRFLDQVLKSVLRPPKVGKDGVVLEASEEEESVYGDYSESNDSTLFTAPGTDNLAGLLYDAGLAAVICSDGRIRSHFYPTTETARWRSARPNLQNFAKRRDADYKRMLGPLYQHKLPPVLVPPPGHVLLEWDLKGAELFGMAILAGDKVMIEHCLRNQLPEDHPDFYDIHSNIAVMAFRLECEPTKKGLKDLGKIHLRIVAKSVIFGIAYGRGAKAIAFAAREEGVNVTEEEAQQIIDTIFELYPGLVPLFESARHRALHEGWICSCFGRYRRFPPTSDRRMQGEFERQAMNFPIQTLVASVMDRVLAWLQHFRDEVIKRPDMFRFAVQIHDAAMMLVPYAWIDYVIDVAVPWALNQVPVYPTALDGVPLNTEPYVLGADYEVSVHWGEAPSVEFCDRHGINHKYAKAA